MLRTAAEHATVSDAIESYQAALDEIPHFLIVWLTHPLFFALLGLMALIFVMVAITIHSKIPKFIAIFCNVLTVISFLVTFFIVPYSLAAATVEIRHMEQDAHDALHADLADMVTANYDVENVEPRELTLDTVDESVEIDRVTFDITSDDHLNVADVTMTQSDALDLLVPVSKEHDILAIREGSLLDESQQN